MDCTLCNWVLRAGWMAQERLSTFGTDLAGGVTLIPDTGGVFQIHCNGVPIWDCKTDGGFPDAKVLKQRVRDQIDPTRNLGHIDRHAASHPAGRSHPAGPLPPNGQPGAPAFADRAIEALTRDGHPAGSAHAATPTSTPPTTAPPATAPHTSTPLATALHRPAAPMPARHLSTGATPATPIPATPTPTIPMPAAPSMAAGTTHPHRR